MFQLALGYLIQEHREREVAADLRNRQALRAPERAAPANGPSSARSATRRAPGRARSTGA
jgi:hypothetical protein